MGHTLEQATSGRAKCRACTQPIAKGELRLGERLPNPFGEGEMTLWYHPACAAYKRPEVALEVLAASGALLPERATLEEAAQRSAAHRRLPRIDGAERAKTGQAKCRHCHEAIARGGWRVRLSFFEDGRFSPGGLVHLTCRLAYFETSAIADALLHFSPELDAGDRAELLREMEAHGVE